MSALRAIGWALLPAALLAQDARTPRAAVRPAQRAAIATFLATDNAIRGPATLPAKRH